MSLNNQPIQIQYYQDYHHRRANKSLSNFDVTYRFISDVTWLLPFGRDRYFVRDGWLSKVIGGFSAKGTKRFPAFHRRDKCFVARAGVQQFAPKHHWRRDHFGEHEGRPLAAVFQYVGLAQPMPYSFGNAPRTLPNLRGLGYFTTNLSLQRDFKFTETAKLQIRAEAFNLFNRANFQTPGTAFGATNFDITSSTEDPRQIQFAARFYF